MDTFFLIDSEIEGLASFGLEASFCSDALFNTLDSGGGNLKPNFIASSDSSLVCEDENQLNSSSLLALPSPNVESQLLQDWEKKYNTHTYLIDGSEDIWKHNVPEIYS